MNIFKTTFLTFISILFIGCSDTPKSTVEDMYDSLKHGEVANLYRITTESKARALTLEALKTCSVDKASYNKEDLSLGEDCFKEMYGNISVKSIEVLKATENEAFVKIVYDDNNETITNREYLRKRDGKWIIFIYQ